MLQNTQIFSLGLNSCISPLIYVSFLALHAVRLIIAVGFYVFYFFPLCTYKLYLENYIIIVFPLKRYLVIVCQCIGIDFKVRKVKSLMGLKVHQDGVELANFLEWRSVIVSIKQCPINDILELMKIKVTSITSN
jgi:hypothetical protein